MFHVFDLLGGDVPRVLTEPHSTQLSSQTGDYGLLFAAILLICCGEGSEDLRDTSNWDH